MNEQMNERTNNQSIDRSIHSILHVIPIQILMELPVYCGQINSNSHSLTERTPLSLWIFSVTSAFNCELSGSAGHFWEFLSSHITTLLQRYRYTTQLPLFCAFLNDISASAFTSFAPTNYHHLQLSQALASAGETPSLSSLCALIKSHVTSMCLWAGGERGYSLGLIEMQRTASRSQDQL